MRLLAALSISAAVLIACEPERPVAPQPSGTAISVRFEFVRNGSPFGSAELHPDGADHAMRYSTLRFIASGFALFSASGEVLADFPSKAAIPDAFEDAVTWPLGRITHGEPTALRMHLGLDSALNHANPVTLPFPLSSPEIHWSWNPAAGFKFLEMEGRVDADADGAVDGAADQLFLCHCATDALMRTDSVEVQPTMEGGTMVLVVPVDVGALLTGIDLLLASEAMGADPPCAQAMDNLVSAVGGP